MVNMDNEHKVSSEPKDSADRRNSVNPKENTEYMPTRCRITKPIPPKPATNPMQFVKVGPCGLYRKAQEQLKKVEEVKTIRQEIRDDAEDWQANLDNWKSCRRKRQEHIIERVVEVKKLEQQEMERNRRKGKTFNEMLEERNRRKCKLNISIFDDDPNDLSDYGIGTNQTYRDAKSIDSDTSLAEDKDSRVAATTVAAAAATPAAVAVDDDDHHNDLTTQHRNDQNSSPWCCSSELESRTARPQSDPAEQYTYEGAIEGYRTRVINKNNLMAAVASPSQAATSAAREHELMTQTRVNIRKRKELFEKLQCGDGGAAPKVPDDFINSQSLKERLISLQKYAEHASKIEEAAADAKNNNSEYSETTVPADSVPVRRRVSHIDSLKTTALDNEEPESEPEPTHPPTPKSVIYDWSNTSKGCSDPGASASASPSPTTSPSPSPSPSPQPGNYVNKINSLHQSLDNLTDANRNEEQLNRVYSLDGLEYCESNNYPASNSSTELLVLSSQCGDTDREDSGIHTTDVSCSVSQAGEPVEDSEVLAAGATCPTCPVCPACPEKAEAEQHAVQMSSLSTQNVEYLNSGYPFKLELVFTGEEFPLGRPVTVLEPPKEKPPPPPPLDIAADDSLCEDPKLKRLNSTKRIKNEMRLKRSSFLGIEPEDQAEMEVAIRKPPDLSSFLQKESRLERQLYKKTQGSYSEAGDSQDSGVELERGRLSSDTWCSSLADGAPTPVHHQHHHQHHHHHHHQDSEPCTTNSITSEDDEMVKKEREIIEMVEKEEKWKDKRQCSTYSGTGPELATEYIMSEDDDHSDVLRVEKELLQLERESRPRSRLPAYQAYLKGKPLSMEDITAPLNKPMCMYPMDGPLAHHRKSMPELQLSNILMRRPWPQPALPPYAVCRQPQRMAGGVRRPPRADLHTYNQHWLIQEAEQRRITEQKHCQPVSRRPIKHLPDSIIQTLTQRVQHKVSLSERERSARLGRTVDRAVDRYVPQVPHSVGRALPIHHPTQLVPDDSQDKMLSVSGKKKCSYCGSELGRGAAMIIESLCLFYHMQCFKCCVCHMQLGDGLMGTDVRVRNNKLHCHNCYSSDDGVKFSCV